MCVKQDNWIKPQIFFYLEKQIYLCSMNKIFFIILLFFGTRVFSQTTDILYVPDQKSLLLTYKGWSPLGFYLGGYFITNFPQPYIYTTPISIINRAGINLNVDNKVSVMGGFFIESFQDSLSLKPDIWVKVNPLRTILKTDRGFDFSLGVNYMKREFRYAVGLSIPIRGIY